MATFRSAWESSYLGRVPRLWRESTVRRRPNGTGDAPRVISCCGAVLLIYVGLAHEMIGLELYPEGATLFGGMAGWHAAGLLLILGGLLILAGALGVLWVPMATLGAAIAAAGFAVALVHAVTEGRSHFFALTLLVAGAAIAVSNAPHSRRRRARRAASTGAPSATP